MRAALGIAALGLCAAARGADVAVSVDPTQGRHPVSRLIYGASYGDNADAASRRWTVRRWGGNSTTRYNWQADVHNTANDWFFMNIPDSPDPSGLPDGSSADLFLDANHAAGAESLLTIPTIGWAPLAVQAKKWGFSIAKYGAQTNNEFLASGGQFWAQADAGNGVCAGVHAPYCAGAGQNVVGNDPADTSFTVGPSFESAWIAHIQGRLGTAAQGGVRFYALDNEPMLWSSTHRDVHPGAATYDEVWGKTAAYASAIKAQDPAAQVLGPDEWGWCAYFWSGRDGCGDGGPDLTSHGSLHWVDYYLSQINAYAASHSGLRLVDYLDLHYYPQAGEAFSDDSAPGIAALRLRSIKSLYDPTYVDESWIGSAGYDSGIVRLIPRMKQWAAAVPGMKTAITEYNWGDDDSPSGALAQAEVLAIFGREGLDLATRWIAPAPGSLTQDAFDLFLNYDGAGARIDGQSVRAISANVDSVGAYAIQSLNNTLYVLLFNKDTASRSVAVSVAGGLPAAPVALWGFEPAVAGRLGARGTATGAAGTFTVTIPARAARLAVLSFPSGARFYTVAPCRLVDTRGAAGADGGPALAANASRTFPIAGQCGIPASARAVSANVTAVAPSSAGDLRLYPGDAAVPNASAINFRAGRTRANDVILALATDGDGSIGVRADMPSGSVHMILDVNGYFK